MEIEVMRLSDLKPDDNNIRVHGDTQINELVKSIEQNGILRPIIVDEDGRILACKGLYLALMKMGKETAEVIVKRGLTEKQKKKLMLADNKIFSLGLDNFTEIENVLKSLDGDFDVPGYDSNVLEELYGIKSIEEEAIPKIPTETPELAPFAGDGKLDAKRVEAPSKPTERLREAREEAIRDAERFVVCPHCGGKVYL